MAETTTIIARAKEQRIFTRMLKENKAQFLAIYGRRRIGKTFLIREFFKNEGRFFEVVGIKDGSMQDQLAIFRESLEKTFLKGTELAEIKSWRDAFSLLTKQIQSISGKKKVIIFLDETPWLATKKSKFLQELDHVWNAYWSNIPSVILVTCGSAASWMLNQLIQAKGGLHNRITHRMRLDPLDLKETKEYLLHRGISYTNSQIVELYLATGGVPYYLDCILPGHSPTQNIQNLCFSKNGSLSDEFPRLFYSLFEDSTKHEAIIKALASSRSGLSRGEILAKTKLDSGGGLTTALMELTSSAFIEKLTPLGRSTRDSYFRLIDEYSLFYLKWIAPIAGKINTLPSEYWHNKSSSPSWRIWAGYSFEALCQKHIAQVLKGLGISGIGTEIYNWRFIPEKKSEQKGAQIDLVIDRADGIINLCEIKHYDTPFTITKDYAAKIREKKATFLAEHPTRKAVTNVMISIHGVVENSYYQELISNQLTIDDFFL